MQGSFPPRSDHCSPPTILFARRCQKIKLLGGSVTGVLIYLISEKHLDFKITLAPFAVTTQLLALLHVQHFLKSGAQSFTAFSFSILTHKVSGRYAPAMKHRWLCSISCNLCGVVLGHPIGEIHFKICAFRATVSLAVWKKSWFPLPGLQNLPPHMRAPCVACHPESISAFWVNHSSHIFPSPDHIQAVFRHQIIFAAMRCINSIHGFFSFLKPLPVRKDMLHKRRHPPQNSFIKTLLLYPNFL